MNKARSLVQLAVVFLLMLPLAAHAETRTISWSPVTTYTDGTPIEAGVTVTYGIYWTTDPGLSAASLRTIVASASQTSGTFDPDVLGMPRGQAVYFTGDAVVGSARSALAPALAWTVPVAASTAPVLSSLSIAGPSSVNEGGTGTFTATATWNNGTVTSVVQTWSENSSYASISNGGVLATLAVVSNQTVTVTATFTSGTETRTATQTVTIVDDPSTNLSTPANVTVTGPVATSPTTVFRVQWDPVTTYADGSPVSGATVRYTAYWSTDPTMPASSLQVLGGPTDTPQVDFDPTAAGMKKNKRVYIKTKATDTSGQASPLSSEVAWTADNSGPTAPGRGKIIRR
ncbi:MAG: hypothetical protein ACM3L8_00100 [Verrucomicrobiota bacterium]